jgi:hypothetical protein
LLVWMLPRVRRRQRQAREAGPVKGGKAKEERSARQVPQVQWRDEGVENCDDLEDVRRGDAASKGSVAC